MSRIISGGCCGRHSASLVTGAWPAPCPVGRGTPLVALYLCGADGVWCRHPEGHYLTRHMGQDIRLELAKATLGPDWIAEAPCVFAVSAIMARICVLYGEERGRTRALPMDCGHAAKNLLLQSVALGPGSVPVLAFHDAAVEGVLALPDGQQPMILLPVGHPG